MVTLSLPFRGNFEVALSNTNIGVFKLLENICETILRNRNLKPHYIKMKSGEKVQKTPIAEKMFWSKCYGGLCTLCIYCISSISSRP